MYTHEKNNTLRHYLKRKAASANARHGKSSTYNLDHVPDVIKIFDIEKMCDIVKTHDRKSNLHRSHQRYIDFLEDTLGYLELATVPNTIFDKLDELLLKFPNFEEVIDYYREQMALAQMTDRAVFAATPLLITGRPGIGKTAFCHALAKIVHTHFSLISLSGMTAGFVLGGMSSNWADGKPGRVSEALARGHRANPLIVIDELDKSGGDHRYDPLGPLYQLLEKETSANFVDEGLEIPTDCSHIVWVGTCNEMNLIAEPILSRFTIIEVKAPTPHQMENVLHSIYQKIRQNHVWGSGFSEELSPSVISKIVHSGLEPRLIQQELIIACGKAALRRAAVGLSGNRREISPDDFNPRETGRRKTKMGFV
jgi:ATP-dependent Lon protease